VTKDFVTKHYTEISKKDIDDAHRIIITGTSLQDFEYSRHIDKFAFLRDLSRSDFRKPVLAICAGMQLLCSLYGCEMITGKEIGLVSANFTGEFLGMSGQREIYALHNMTIKDDAVLKENFHVYAKTNSTKTNSDKGGCVQAIKHKHSKIYGVLFHPEVRNEDMIIRFLSV
jgi:GMP synthase (glutamine-hydrolysing)